MKIFVCFLALIVATVATRKSRIVMGTAAKKGENLDFCYLKASYYEKQITCGCLVTKENFVATSARCLVEYEFFYKLVFRFYNIWNYPSVVLKVKPPTLQSTFHKNLVRMPHEQQLNCTSQTVLMEWPRYQNTIAH